MESPEDPPPHCLWTLQLLPLKQQSRKSTEETLDILRDVLRSFPFAAVLPVQPLQYVPHPEGVTITFLRKKTAEKGSVDGGIWITAKAIHDNDDHHMNDMNDGRIMIQAHRNAEGQTVGKYFSETLIQKALFPKLESLQTELGMELRSIPPS